MNLEQVLRLAREERLFPGIILHGGSDQDRRSAIVEIARAVLCERVPEERPCGACRHCRRVHQDTGSKLFHPDFQLLERDLRTSTSTETVRAALRTLQVRPFEARGQVLAIANAETLAPAGANGLLKTLEEPSLSAIRVFLLSTPSQAEILETLRSRCMSLYLGTPMTRLDADSLEVRVGQIREALSNPDLNGLRWYAIAQRLLAAEQWDEMRDSGPWTRSALVLVEAAKVEPIAGRRRALLQLAQDLMEAPALRLRSIPAQRILEGLVSRRVPA